jgi:SAM-dependent methyltransferase
MNEEMSEKIVNSLLPDTWTEGAEEYGDAVHKELQNADYPDAWRQIILARTPGKKPLRILDVGTGPGFFAVILAQAQHDVTGLDFSSGMLDIARKNAADAGVVPNFILGDSYSSRLAPGSFDLILSRMLTWALPDPLAVYRRWFELLAPSGVLMIFDGSNPYTPHTAGNLPKSELDPTGELPLCHLPRPQWDAEALRDTEFVKIVVEEDICSQIWESGKPLYGQTPMFLVSAYKDGV